MLRLLAWLAGALLVLAGGAIWLAIDRQPLVRRDASLSPLAIAQARRLLLGNDPRRLQPGEARTMVVPGQLLDEGINYLATRFLHGRGAFALADGAAEIRLTLAASFPPLNLLPGEHFLNLRLTLSDAAGPPRFTGLRLGALPLPAALADRLLAAGTALSGHGREWQLARRAIRDIRFDAGLRHVVVAYVWNPELLERARSIAVRPERLHRLEAAQTVLAALLEAHPRGATVPLPDILGPLLKAPADDGREGRRAAVFVLAAYLADKDPAAAIPQAADWPRLRPLNLTLLGRHDSAQHFGVSAALAAWAGEPLADAVGLYKELSDARRGSGLSFADLAADRAGTLFGQLIVRRSARLDALLAGGFADADIAPRLADLPENLHQTEFRQRFGTPDSPLYRQQIGEIERRIAALPLYRNLETE